MATYLSTHTGLQIDDAISQVENKQFTSVMNGVTPTSQSGTVLVTANWVNGKLPKPHPIGYIFEWSNVRQNGQSISGAPDLTTPANVAAYFGYGTWELFGVGRVTVGINTSDTDFDTVGETGGEKTHKLTANESGLPQHTHSHSHKFYNDRVVAGIASGKSWSSYKIGSGGGTQHYYVAKDSSTTYDVTRTDTDSTKNTAKGATNAHNNLQPYIVVYRWIRIA